jgi:hypothetical protein
LASQQSIKKYVDDQVTAQDLDVTSDSGTIDIDLNSETLTIAGGTGLASSIKWYNVDQCNNIEWCTTAKSSFTMEPTVC